MLLTKTDKNAHSSARDTTTASGGGQVAGVGKHHHYIISLSVILAGGRNSSCIASIRCLHLCRYFMVINIHFEPLEPNIFLLEAAKFPLRLEGVGKYTCCSSVKRGAGCNNDRPSQPTTGPKTH